MDWKMSMFPLIVTGGFVAHGKRPQLLRKNGLHRTTGKVRHVKIFGTVAGCVLGRVRRAAKWGRLHGAHLPWRWLQFLRLENYRHGAKANPARRAPPRK